MWGLLVRGRNRLIDAICVIYVPLQTASDCFAHMKSHHCRRWAAKFGLCSVAKAFRQLVHVGGILIFIVPPQACYDPEPRLQDCSLIRATYSFALYDIKEYWRQLLFRITIWEDYCNNFIINSTLPSRLSPAFLATLPISLTSFVAFLPSNLMLSADVTVLATNSRSFPAEREGWSIVGSTASIGLLTWWLDGVWLRTKHCVITQ